MNLNTQSLVFRTAVADSSAYSSGDDLYGYNPHRSHGKGRHARRRLVARAAAHNHHLATQATVIHLIPIPPALEMHMSYFEGFPPRIIFLKAMSNDG